MFRSSGQVDERLLLFDGLLRRLFLRHGALQLRFGLGCFGCFGCGLLRCWHKVSSSAVTAAGRAPKLRDGLMTRRFVAL